jgi:hypothetical protein
MPKVLILTALSCVYHFEVKALHVARIPVIQPESHISLFSLYERTLT